MRTVIEVKGALSFDQLLLRIHPAESRARKLAAQVLPSRWAGGLERLFEAIR